jgi:hypothetical protein
VPDADRWTMLYQNTKELVDHQAVSAVLAGMLDQQSVDITHSADVEASSDHAPLYATYKVN